MIKDILNSNCGIRVLIYLYKHRNAFGNKVSMETKITFSHTSHILSDLEKIGYIRKSIKTGRRRYLSLTKKGNEIAKRLSEIERLK